MFFDPQHQKRNVSVLVIVAFLVALGIGIAIGYGIWGTPEKEDDGPSDQVITASGFTTKATADGNLLPWCVGTMYAYSLIHNGVESERSAFTNRLSSASETFPRLQVKLYPNSVVRIYRWVEGKHALEEPITEADLLDVVVDDEGFFVDTDNPCKGVDIPTPTQAMTNHTGVVQAGGVWWNRLAEPGESPWCDKTSYTYAYKAFGIEGDVGPMSDVVFSHVSDPGVEPIMHIPGVREEYDTILYRSVNGGALELIPNPIVEEGDFFIDRANPCTTEIVAPSSSPNFQGWQYDLDDE